MDEPTDIMTDIETLSTEDNAVILSIGAVAFNTTNVYTNNAFYTPISIHQEGRKIDTSTIAWWMKQEPAAQLTLYEACQDVAPTLYNALMDYHIWLSQWPSPKTMEYWQRGDFDYAIIGHAMREACMDLPWNFRQISDHRVIEKLARRIELDNPPLIEGNVKHRALDDAIWQAKQTSYWLRQLDAFHDLHATEAGERRAR